MKNKAIITSLIIIMVGIIALGIGWHKIFDASATKPNLIECKGHIDKNQDMSCDICGAILSGESDTKYKTVKNTLESGTTIEVKGDMPSNAVLTTKEITREVATNIAKRYIPLDDDKVLYAYDISMVLKNKKYQPENYGKDVNITLTNLEIEDQKDVAVMHIIDNKSYEIMKLDELTKNKVSFKATSFSTYIVLEVATYNVTFTGTGNFEVQTIRGNKITNSTELVSGTNFTFVVTPKAGYGISGITTSNGTITTNGDVLRKTATIDNITQATTITVTTVAAPVVTKQPVTVKVNSGETAIYTVTAQNATTYEWQYRTNENDYWKSASEIGTANNGTLTITNVTDAINGYSIRCMLSNDSFDNGYEVKTDMAYVILAEGTLQMPVAIDEPIKEESKMITEWTIPTGNTEIKLPVQGTGLNITVDWGDGSATETFTTDLPEHTYATAGTYEIKVWGTCPKWGYAGVTSVTTTQNSDYYTYTQYLTKVKQFGELSTTQYGFAQCRNLVEVSGENLVTSKTFENVTDMSHMFRGCGGLTSLDVSKFDTSKVTSMSCMFWGCIGLTSLDVSKFDTSNVTDMSHMFRACEGLTSLDVSNFDTSNVTDMNWMFGVCSGLTSLGVSKFDTSNVTDMSHMFRGCGGLTSLDVSGFDTSNVTTMSGMFYNCSKLTSLGVSKFDTSKVINMSYMFLGCSNLISLDVSKFDTSKVINMANMFISCSGLTSLDVSKFDTSKVIDMGGMFNGCSALTSLDVSKFNTSNVTTMSGMFSNCSKLTSLDVSKFDTSNVKKMTEMFSGCGNLTSLDVSNFDTSNVTGSSTYGSGMYGMFKNCSNLTYLDVSKFDTSKVVNMGNMFNGCSALTSLDVSKFNTSKVTNMSGMFSSCSKLTSLDVSGFDTSKVTDMSDMFRECSGLTSLDVSKFDTSKVVNMGYMFKGCTSLKTLQLSNKFVIPASNNTNMFTNTTNLTSIILVDNTPLASQFTNIKAKLDGKTFYVPSKSAETAYETSWAVDFTADRIQPILELVGDENVTINAGDTYTDAGYTVAGFDTANSGDYTVYGYNVTTSGEVNTAVAGTYKIDYTITRTYNNAGTTQTDTLMTVTRNITVKEVIKEESKMITEWNVSGDAGLTIKLPAQAYGGTSLNITVDWGDGSAEQTFTTNFPAHTYATAGTYEIKVWGTCPKWGYASGNTVSSTSNSNYYTYTQYLTKVKQFGELGAQQYGFAQCKNLTEVSGDNLVTNRTFEKTASMAYMFYSCSNLTSLDVSGFDTSKVTNMSYMFRNCSKLTSLDVSGFDTSKVTNMSYMFDNCSKLTSLDVSGFDTSSVTNMKNMFSDCSNLTSLDVSGFDTSKVTSMSYMFSKCSKLTSLDVSGFDTANVTTMSGMFYNCTNLTSLDVSKFNTSNVTTMLGMFSNCSNLTSLDVSKFNTSKVTNMGAMFSGCSKLISLDVSGFDTSKVTNMSWMFSFCSNLTSLDVSGFDTSKVTDMGDMFYDCSKLTSLDVSGFDTSKVTDMDDMFSYCSNLTSLDVSGFDTSNVTNMNGMFSSCSSLSSLDVSGFNTSKVTDMSYMFYVCSKLKFLQLSNKFKIPTSNNTNIFADTTSLNSLILVDNEPLASQFTSVKSQLTGKTFYVPSKSAETAYETSWSADFSGDRIRQILELVGDENVTINAGDTYTDAGYTVAGLTTADAQYYTPYGYKVTKTGEVVTSTVGVYQIKYEITRTYNNAGTTQTDTLMNVTRNVIVKGSMATSMITEWTIPTDNTTIKLPATKYGSTSVNIVVDWGDGTIAEAFTTDFPTHTYATAGTYEIKVWGTCPKWGYANLGSVSTTSNSDYYTSTQYLTKVKQFGELSAVQYGFAQCKNLIEVSGENLVTSKTFEKTTNMSYMFYYCRSLTSLDVSKFDTSKVTNMSYMFSRCGLISLDISNFNTFKVTDMSYMFGVRSVNNEEISGIKEIKGLENINTSNVISMMGMFQCCAELEYIDVSNFDTSKVTNMSWMFDCCSNLTNLNVSKFDTSKVTDMSMMFYACGRLTNLDVNNFNTSKVTNMKTMFGSCYSLKTLQLSNKFVIPASNNTNMFSGTTNLTSIILVDTTPLASQFTNIKAQLDGKTFYVPSKSAETAYETSWAADFTADRIHPILELVGDENVTIDVGSTYTDAGYTVAGLTTADAQYYTPYGYGVTKTGEVVTSTVGVYQIKYEITRTYNNAGVAQTDTLMNVTRNVIVKGSIATSMITEWRIPSANTTIKLPVQSHGGNSLNITVDWGDGSAVQTVTTNFPTHTYTTAGTYDITVSGTCPAWGYMGSGRVSTTLNSDYYTYTQYLTKVKQFGELNAQYYGFSQCTNLTSVKGATTNSTSNVTTMANMFYSCQRLKELDLTNFDTSKVTDMNHMLFKAGVQEIDLSSFNTSGVTNMSAMFGQCGFLTKVNLSSFNTSKVTNMTEMFIDCSALTNLDLSKFKTSKVTYMNEMFSNCTSLKSLKVSALNFNTVNVINMRRMFYNCSSLTEIPVAKFNTSKVTNFDEMFARCSSLKTLNLSNFVVSNYFEGDDSNSMLNGCTSLRSIQISSTFKVPMSKMFLNTPNLTAIIVLGNTPSAEQFSPCIEDLEGKTFYVTDEEFLEIYRKAWEKGFSEDRIKPLLELKGSSPITITKGTNYVDAGYTIAGFTEEDEIYYSVYGYSATVKSTVDSSVIGSYSVTYTLKRKDSSSGLGMVEILMNVVRVVVVEEGNIVGLDIIPPTGSITVKDATIRNNINYVPSSNVTLEISAQDNISTSSEIKVYITTEAIDLTKTIADALWENYSNGMTKTITITNLSATTRIYALFKDAAGNTSAASTGADTEYSIIYNLNGGTGSIENGTANYGSPAILSNKVPTKSGMYFLGWSTNASATVASYKAGGIMQADTFSGTNKNINLYAVWGNKPLISEVVEIGDLIDLPIYYNDLSGNNRTDWKVISKVENSTTGRSSVVVISTGIPLTLANTSADLVNDFFNMNNYSENGFENNIELSELFLNKYVDVSDEKPNVKGTKNGNNVYVLITLKDLTLTAGKNAYDKWSAEKQLDKITVSFNANGGTLTEVSKDVVYAGKYGTLPTPTREGYQFDGWYTRSVDGTLVKDTTKVTKNYNHTLYAHWTSIGYTFVLSFDSNGGTGTMTTQSYTEGKAQAIKANTFTKAGYTFAGWATSANGGVVYADKASIILTENTTLYAIWNKNNSSPNAPTVTVSSKTTDSVTLSIVGTDPDEDDLIYDIYMNGVKNGTTEKANSGKAVMYSISGLSEYTQYAYKVVAKDPYNAENSASLQVRTYCPGTGVTCQAGTYCDTKCKNCAGMGYFTCSCTCSYERKYAEVSSYSTSICKCVPIAGKYHCDSCWWASVDCTECGKTHNIEGCDGCNQIKYMNNTETCEICNGYGSVSCGIAAHDGGITVAHYYCEKHKLVVYGNGLHYCCEHGYDKQHD